MSLRVRVAPLVAIVVGLAIMMLPAAAVASCPNEEIRAEQGSERLPDCRAFELVTPEIKGDDSTIGGGIDGIPYGFPDGNHVFFRSLIPLPGAQNGELQDALSSRTPAGWVTTPLQPPATKGEPIGLLNGSEGNGVGEAAFNGDLSAGYVNTPFNADPLDADSGVVDVYRVAAPSGAPALAALPDSGPLSISAGLKGTWIAGVSANGAHVLFETQAKLTTAPGTPVDTHTGGDELYDRSGGHTYLVGVLPDGSVPACGADIGLGAVSASVIEKKQIVGAISPDGSNVVFNTCSGTFLRENNSATVELQGSFVARSADGTKVFTLATDGRINEYDVATGTTTTISTEGAFVASSADGARVYYLISGGPKAGLYFWEGGPSELIPSAGEEFFSRPQAPDQGFPSEADLAVATPDGSRLLFLDRAKLTANNTVSTGCEENNILFHGGGSDACIEAYVYNAVTKTIVCVSCNPNNAPPLGPAHLLGEVKNSEIPGYSPGTISVDGSRVFFETEDALVPQDTNGTYDVYEWENGRIYLISSGQGSYGTQFSGASSSGNDVFLTTTDHLAPQDIENSTEVYDARVGGGFAYKPFTSGCDSGQCQGPQTPAPVFGAPASATFVGIGNPPPATKVKAKPKVKPKKRTKAHRKRKAKRSGRISIRTGSHHCEHKGRI